MPSTPDPNYWGNPPQTPRSRNIPQRPSPKQAPQPPQAASQQANAGAPQANQAAGSQSSTNGAASHSAQPNGSCQTTAQEAYTTPIAPPAPNQPTQKNHTALIVVIAIVAAVLVGMGGCVACATVVSTALDDQDAAWYTHDNSADQKGTYYDAPKTEQESLNRETRRDFGLAGNAALSNAELDTIQSNRFGNASKAPDASGAYAAGVYHVGTDIPAGSYWFTGSETSLSYFYILQPASSSPSAYDTVHINSYYGHNLMDLQDGDVLILNNKGTMVPINKMNDAFTAPYGSGVYRVGTDIPEGTYQLIVGDGANDYSACYVMSDLNFDEDSSYLYSDYFVKGDNPETITLEAGTYIELYNMQMKPAGLA